MNISKTSDSPKSNRRFRRVPFIVVLLAIVSLIILPHVEIKLSYSQAEMGDWTTNINDWARKCRKDGGFVQQTRWSPINGSALRMVKSSIM